MGKEDQNLKYHPTGCEFPVYTLSAITWHRLNSGPKSSKAQWCEQKDLEKKSSLFGLKSRKVDSYVQMSEGRHYFVSSFFILSCPTYSHLAER